MDVIRRPSLLEPGEPLLLCRSTIETAARFAAFLEEFGIPSNAVVTSTLCSMPLPVYPRDSWTLVNGRPRRRWEGARAEAMWHPLMWLPERLAHRYDYLTPDGSRAREDDDLWAIRLAFELTAAGLYDPDSGTWVDVLSTVGVDIDDELDLARVEDWLEGESDPILDAIDLSQYLDVEHREWALESAIALRDDLEYGSWALIADDLLGLADDTLDPAVNLSPLDTLKALRSLVGLGEALLDRVPNTTEGGVDTGALGGEDHMLFFGRIHDSINLDTAQPEQFIAEDYIAQVRQRLYAIRESFWPYLEELSHLEDDVDAPLAAPVPF